MSAGKNLDLGGMPGPSLGACTIQPRECAVTSTTLSAGKPAAAMTLGIEQIAWSGFSLHANGDEVWVTTTMPAFTATTTMQ